jgi:hypothetical protein
MLTPFMAPSRTPADARRAPSSGSGAPLRLPGEHEPPPYVDERLVKPETREEMVRGRRVHAAPALPEHADEHTELSYVIRGSVAPGHIASTDLLTRAGPGSDFATDTCIRRAGIDPRTGSRFLEELAFEVVNEQSASAMIERAEDLTTCGIRRVFAIFVKKGEVCEWSTANQRFVPLDLDSAIEDPTLVRPVLVRALLDAAVADDALVDALEAKGNPRLAQKIARGEERGEERGLARAIEIACEVLGLRLGPPERSRLTAMDAAGLESLLTHLWTERRWPDP